jgi:hypothetical protein
VNEPRVPTRTLLVALAFLALSACTPRPTASPSPAAPSGGGAATEASGSEEAFLPARLDAETGKLFLTVRELGRDMLYMNTLATGLGAPSAGLDRGQVGLQAVVRFERQGPRVLLVQDNASFVAQTDNPYLRRSVEESFPRSVLASFPIEREEGGTLVVDATSFFMTDVFGAGSRLSARVDAGRSYVDPEMGGAFPTNTEVRSVLSFTSDNPGGVLRRHAPDARSFTLEQHHSFVVLPDDDFERRPYHPQAGVFSHSVFDYALGFDSDYRRRWVARWRLVPSDPAAHARGELVEPVEPIVYYLDRGIPEPYRSAFREGGLWWNEIFEAAGFRNAFRIEDLPEDANPLDARYSMIYWVHRTDRGPSVGPSFRDPRSGEILRTVVRMDSYRSLVNYDVYMGMLPAAGSAGLSVSAEEYAMARRRQHTAHEIGHTLGFAHNFIAATQNRSSVMDYPVGLATVGADGNVDISDAYRTSGGAFDTLSVRYAYTPFASPEAEEAGLRALIRDANARGLRFITGGDAGAQGSHPGATQWVEGADMLEALERTSEVRRLLVDRFDERALTPGEPFSFLNKRFAFVYLHHRSALQGAVKYVGGMEYSYGLYGDDAEPMRIVAPAEQRRALRMVLSEMDPSRLRVPERVTRLVGPSPSGYDGSEEVIGSPAGPALDPVWVGHSLAQEIVDNLLHPQRMARVQSFHARDPANPSADEVLGALVETTWGNSEDPGTAEPQDAALRRAVQRAALDGLLDLAGSGQATAGVRAIAEHHLAALGDRLSGGGTGAAGTPAEAQAHRATALRDVERYFAGEDDPGRRPRPEAIPLPWP